MRASASASRMPPEVIDRWRSIRLLPHPHAAAAHGVHLPPSSSRGSCTRGRGTCRRTGRPCARARCSSSGVKPRKSDSASARGAVLYVSIVTPILLEQAAQVGLAVEDADRARHGQRQREDVLARARHVVPAARRHRAHRHDERLALAEQRELPPHHVARERRAARALDAQHHRADRRRRGAA